MLSERPRLLFDYFAQLFAQVTNPPLDAIREELVMSLVSMIGPRPNLLGRQAGTHTRLEVSQPVLTNAELEKVRSISELLDGAFRPAACSFARCPDCRRMRTGLRKFSPVSRCRRAGCSGHLSVSDVMDRLKGRWGPTICLAKKPEKS